MRVVKRRLLRPTVGRNFAFRRRLWRRNWRRLRCSFRSSIQHLQTAVLVGPISVQASRVLLILRPLRSRVEAQHFAIFYPTLPGHLPGVFRQNVSDQKVDLVCGVKAVPTPHGLHTIVSACAREAPIRTLSERAKKPCQRGAQHRSGRNLPFSTAGGPSTSHSAPLGICSPTKRWGKTCGKQ